MTESTTIQKCFEIAECSPLVMAPSLDFEYFYGAVHEALDTGDIAKYFAKTLFSMMQIAISKGVVLVEIESAVRVQASNHVYAAETHQPYEPLSTNIRASEHNGVRKDNEND